MTFRIGQRVCCVHDGRWFPDPRDAPIHNYSEGGGPSRGDVVTINHIEDETVEGQDLCWLGLAEWPGDLFEASYFRPLTDISVFERMLAQQPVTEDA